MQIDTNFLVRSSDVKGDKVVNPQGDDLGRIEDTMVDVAQGKIAYAVLSFGGFLGMGNKLFAIPWGALQLDAENHQFILNVDKTRLETAQGFDKNHWPPMADRKWGQELHTYYGHKPYWDKTPR